jgi:hypothetical protein
VERRWQQRGGFGEEVAKRGGEEVGKGGRGWRGGGQEGGWEEVAKKGVGGMTRRW